MSHSPPQPNPTQVWAVQIDSNTVEIEERGVKLRLAVAYTPGFGYAIHTTDSLKEIIISLHFDRSALLVNQVIKDNILDN